MDIKAMANRIVAAATEKDVEVIEKMTDQNDHTGALVYLYEKVLRDKKAVQALHAIDVLHQYFGHMPRELSDLRHKEFYAKAMKRIQRELPEDMAKRIYMAF